MQVPILALGGAGLIYLGAQFLTVSTMLGSALLVASLVCFGWSAIELVGILLPKKDH